MLEGSEGKILGLISALRAFSSAPMANPLKYGMRLPVFPSTVFFNRTNSPFRGDQRPLGVKFLPPVPCWMAPKVGSWVFYPLSARWAGSEERGGDFITLPPRLWPQRRPNLRQHKRRSYIYIYIWPPKIFTEGDVLKGLPTKSLLASTRYGEGWSPSTVRCAAGC